MRRRRPFARKAPADVVDVPAEQQSPGTTAALHAIATEFYNGLRGLEEERDAPGTEGPAISRASERPST